MIDIRRLVRAMGAFVKQLWFSLPLVLTMLLSYGTRVTTVSISLDDLCRQRYLTQYYYAQNRFGGPLFFRLLSITKMYPFAEKALSVLLLGVAAILFCVLFTHASKGQLNRNVYPVFACLFVSYPLIAEVWNYSGTDCVIALSFSFCALALLSATVWRQRRKIRYFVFACLMAMFSNSFFESLSTVYICAVFAVLILRYAFHEEQARRWKHVLFDGLSYAAVLAVGVLLRMLISFGIRFSLEMSHFAGATNTITYGESGLPFFTQLFSVGKDMLLKYFFAGFYYFPIGIFGTALLLSVVLLIVFLTRKKGSVALLLFAGLIGGCFALSLLQGATTPYRAAQPLWLFCPFIFMLTLHFLLQCKARSIRYAAFAAACLLCFYQSMNLNKWFSLNYLRSEEDARMIESIAERLYTEHDDTKPVVFVGSREVSPHIYDECCASDEKLGFQVYTELRRLLGVAELLPGFRFTQTCVSAYTQYAVYMADPTLEMFYLFEYYGHSFAAGTHEQWEEAHAVALDAACWPSGECIIDMPSYTIVKLGNDYMGDFADMQS